MVIVDVALALICFAGQCHHALVGPNTPTGEYQMVHAVTHLPGYGGDVLVFAEDDKMVYAIHRVYTLGRAQHREKRIKSENAADRVGVTAGCINISPEVYEQLLDCCSNQTLIIK